MNKVVSITHCTKRASVSRTYSRDNSVPRAPLAAKMLETEPAFTESAQYHAEGLLPHAL